MPPTVEGTKITYKSILPGTDLREIIVKGGVKEDIVLNKYTGKNTFTFELKTTGVTAQKEVASILADEEAGVVA